MSIDRHALRKAIALAVFAAAGGWLTASAADSAGPKPASAPPAPTEVFAKVGDVVVTHDQFQAAFGQAARGKFYHGKAPDGAVAALQREVGQGIVDEILLSAEARRRNIEPDQEAVQRTIDSYDERYRANPQWRADRDLVLPALKAKLERDSLLDRLAKAVKSVADPSEQELQQYWEAHQDKFTAPERVRLSVILLRVDPSSLQATWDERQAEGKAIVKQLRDGADFKELAQRHSGDPSAANGGDMGYMHKSALPEPAQVALDKLGPGEFTDALVLLEGVAVLRLEDRKASRLNPLEAVRERARDLWKRDKGEEAWKALAARLRAGTTVELDESRFLPLATAAPAGNKAEPR